MCHSAPNLPGAKPCSKVTACLGECSPPVLWGLQGRGDGAQGPMLVPAGLLTCTVPEDPVRGSESHLHRGMLPWDIRARNQPPGLWLRVLVLDEWPLSKGTGIGFNFPSASLQGTKRLFWRCLAAFCILFFLDLSWWVLPRRTILSWTKMGEFLCIKFSWAVPLKDPHTADTVSDNQVRQFNCTKITDAVSLTH